MVPLLEYDQYRVQLEALEEATGEDALDHMDECTKAKYELIYTT